MIKQKLPLNKVVLFTVIGIVALPVLYIGASMGSFTVRCSNGKTSAREVEKKIEAMSLPTTQRSASVNGDCTTATGTSYSFDVKKDYVSTLEAKDDIIKKLSASGIPAPELAQPPEHIYATNSNVTHQTPEYIRTDNSVINEITLEYKVKSLDSLTLHLKLVEPIACQTVSNDEIVCAGEAKDVLVNKLITDRQISSVHVVGTARHN